MIIPSFLQNLTRTLPNGGGDYTTANSTFNGINQPVMAPNPMFNTPDIQAPVVDQPVVSTPAPVMPQSGPSYSGIPTPQQPPVQPAPVPEAPVAQEPFDPLRAYRDLAMEQAMHSSQGTGLYALKKGVAYSPEQIMSQRKAADSLYDQALKEYADMSANDQRKLNKDDVEVISDYSSDPWMQGLVINGLVQGGTAKERKAHEAMLAKLPTDQKQQLIKSSLYNSMSPAERATFDTGDNLGAGVQQIISDQPADFSTNPYKYAEQKYSVYLGGEQDPKYLNFKSMVGNLSAPIINQIYGAAVTGSELARAQNFIPDLATDSTAMAMTKLKHLAGFYEYANAKKLARKSGVPLKETMDDYISKYDTTNNTSGGFSESW